MKYTLTLPCVDSARLYGSSNSWEAKYSNKNEVTAGMYSGTRHTAFFRFGSFEIPPYANIISASFKFRITGVYKTSGFTFSITDATDNGTLWTSSSRNGAATGSAAKSTVYLSSADKWYTANVVALAQAWQSGAADPERGLAMTAGGVNSWKRIAKETSSYVPELTIEYEVPASIPVLDKSTLALGSVITTNLITQESGSNHVIRYKIGDATLEERDIGAAVSDSYNVPATAGAYFPNSTAGTLTVEVTTTVNGETRGTSSVEATLTVPDDAAPRQRRRSWHISALRRAWKWTGSTEL